METVLFIPGLGAPYAEEQYALDSREIVWGSNQFGVRHLSGVVTNNSNKDLDWVRVEFILYNKLGLPVGTTSDCLIGFPSGNSWKFQAPVNQIEANRASETLLSCEYGRVTKVRRTTPVNGSAQPQPQIAGPQKNGSG